MEEKGYSAERFNKLIERLVENIKPAIIAKDKQVSVGILMLLSVIVRKEELLNSLWKVLFREGQLVECIDYFYRLFCIISHSDLFLAQARCQYITDPDELKENHRRRAEMFREYLYEKKNIKKNEMWEMRQSNELDFPESASILS